MVVTPTCESIDISICPADPGYTYYLYDSLGAFLKESTEPYFSGLNSGTVYQVKSFNPTISLDTLDFLVKTNTLAPKYIPNNITCSSFDIVPEGFIWDVFDSTIYELYDMSGLLLKSSFSPSFDSLSAGQYRFRVYHRTCGERFNTVIIPEPKKPEICIGPDYIYNPNSGRKEFAWKIKYGPTAKNINISGNQYTQYQRSYDYEGVHELILLPGKYFTKSNCLLDTFDLPSYNFKLNLQVSGMCPGFGKIIPGGWPTDAEWEAFFEPLGLKFCPSRGPVYLIFDKDWNQLTSFQNLPSGEVYNVVMTSFGAAPLDTIKVASPFYFRPNLSSTFGAVCSSSPVGSVVLSSNGGTPPFTFQMLNPPSGQEIITRDSIAQFNNLPAGSYTFRVFDSCGISSDFATSVDALNFVPYYRRFCDGNIQLFAPNVTNATY
jgi:hypothetical protein